MNLSAQSFLKLNAGKYECLLQSDLLILLSFFFLFGFIGSESLLLASAEEEPSHWHAYKDEPPALPGGQQDIFTRLQEHRW